MRKTIFAFAALFVLFTVFSCGKDDNDDTNGTIVGKWYAKTAVIKTYIGTTPVSDSTYSFTSGEYIEFKSDGTFVSTDEDGTAETYTYTYDANTKTLSTNDEDDGISNATVTKLTGSDLTLHGEETDTFEGVTYKSIIDLYLKK